MSPRTRRLVLRFVRIWLPAGVVLGGLISYALDPHVDGLMGAAHIVGAGLAIWLLNLLTRIGFSGDRDRREEDDARAFFDRHGHWPDEQPGERPTIAPPPRPAPVAPAPPPPASHRRPSAGAAPHRTAAARPVRHAPRRRGDS